MKICRKKATGRRETELKYVSPYRARRAVALVSALPPANLLFSVRETGVVKIALTSDATATTTTKKGCCEGGDVFVDTIDEDEQKRIRVQDFGISFDSDL